MSADAGSGAGDHDAEVTVAGRSKTEDAGTVYESLEVAGTSTTTTATIGDGVESIDLYVTGEQNTVKVRGYDETVNVYHEGQHNTVRVPPKARATTRRDEGAHWSIDRDPDLETEPDENDLIRRTREEAYSDLGLVGYGTVTYQTDASEQGRCRYCGREADDVVHRHQERVLSVLGLTLTVESGDVSDECEYCTTKVDVGLSEEERYTIFE